MSDAMGLCVVCLFPSVLVQLYLPSVCLFVFVMFCVLFVGLFLFLEGLIFFLKVSLLALVPLYLVLRF